MEAINLSINFWFVTPLVFPSMAPVIHPALEGLFNIVVAWGALFVGFLRCPARPPRARAQPLRARARDILPQSCPPHRCPFPITPLPSLHPAATGVGKRCPCFLSWSEPPSSPTSSTCPTLGCVPQTRRSLRPLCLSSQTMTGRRSKWGNPRRCPSYSWLCSQVSRVKTRRLKMCCGVGPRVYISGRRVCYLPGCGHTYL